MTKTKRTKAQTECNYFRGVVTLRQGDKYLSVHRNLWLGKVMEVAHQIHLFVVEVNVLTWRKFDCWSLEPSMRTNPKDGQLVVQVEIGCATPKAAGLLADRFRKQNWEVVRIATGSKAEGRSE